MTATMAEHRLLRIGALRVWVCSCGKQGKGVSTEDCMARWEAHKRWEEEGR